MTDANDVLDSVAKHQDRVVAVFIAVLAVLLAICEMGGNNAEKDAVKANIDVANTYAFFQAKNMRQTSIELSVADMKLRLMDEPAPSPRLASELKAQIAKLETKAKRYQSDPRSGEGKIELLAKAKDLEKTRDDALARDPYFDFASALFQIAIVLASVAIVMDSRIAFSVSGAVGFAGCLLMLNGFLMFMRLPMLG